MPLGTALRHAPPKEALDTTLRSGVSHHVLQHASADRSELNGEVEVAGWSRGSEERADERGHLLHSVIPSDHQELILSRDARKRVGAGASQDAVHDREGHRVRTKSGEYAIPGTRRVLGISGLLCRGGAPTD